MKKYLAVIIFVLLTGCTGQYMLWFPIISIPHELTPYELTPYKPVPAPYKLIPPGYYISEQTEIPQYDQGPNQRRPMVALTFDDGPSRHTERILDLLEEYGGRATFFVVGSRVRSHNNTVARAADMGNEIANHSFSHANLTLLSEYAIKREIQLASGAIEAVVGFSPTIMRPPFGAVNNRVERVAGDMGYSIIIWNLDTLDWKYRNPTRIYNVIMSKVQDGSVILLHDLHETTADAMEQVIPRLVSEGYHLVTVSELLEYFNGELEPGIVYN